MAGAKRPDATFREAWRPPKDWPRMTTIEAHTAGEPLRIYTSGFPEPEGSTMLAKRAAAKRDYDHLRRLSILEPRGHADMYGCLLTQPVTEDGDLGVLFLHNEGLSTMCGHGIIALTTVGIECQLFDYPLLKSGEGAPIRIDTPAGRVVATPHFKDYRVDLVSFRNVASFLLQRDLLVDVPELESNKSVTCDLAFGGAFYLYVDGPALGLKPDAARELILAAAHIKRAFVGQHEIVHPCGGADLNFLYGIVFVWRDEAVLQSSASHSRNVCVFAEGEVDRSPTGTGVSGRIAVHYARGEVALGQRITIESILGTTFDVTAVDETTVGDCPAVVPEVCGRAFITGRHELLVDPQDPLKHGFFLR